MVSITGLELSYTQAPNKMKSAVMAAWLFCVSLGNAFTAGVNFFIANPDGTSKMSDFNYYLFFAGLMLVASLIFAIVANFYKYRTYLQIAGRTDRRSDASRPRSPADADYAERSRSDVAVAGDACPPAGHRRRVNVLRI